MEPFSTHTESHAQSNTQENPSLYGELNDKTLDIRILKLLPGTEEISCTLRRVSCIPKYPEYTALSYCWGGTSEKNSIWINGHRISITKNLFEALKVLRQRQISVLWIDAICINQNDEAEKSHQVQRMAEVYRNASQTVAWLGRDNPYSDEVFDVLTLLASDQISKRNRCKEGIILEQPSGSSKAATKVEALNSFVSLSYWERTWIIQELALSRNVVFIWDEQLWYETTIHAVVRSIRRTVRLRDKLPNWATMRGVFLTIRGFRQRQSLPLSMLLSDTTLSKATEQQDKIFAILGLVEEGFKLAPEVDYSKPLNDILRSAMILSFTTTEKETTGMPMDLICLGDPGKPKRLSLPSWVIDWKTLWGSSSKSAHRFSSPGHRGLLNEYCACGLMTASIDFSEDGRTMIASGYVFDTIQSLSKASEHINKDPKILPPEVPDTPDCARFGVYGTQISLRNAIWRSLVYDRGVENKIRLRSSEAPAVFEHYFQVYFTEKALFFSRYPGFSRYLFEQIGPMLVFDKTIEDWAKSDKEECFTLEDSSIPSMEDFIHAVVFRSFGRRFMITKKGYVGIAHAQGQVGDSIVLLRGCTMPMILRECDGGWRVVGEAYVHGIMNGEAWREREEEEMEIFYLK